MMKYQLRGKVAHLFFIFYEVSIKPERQQDNPKQTTRGRKFASIISNKKQDTKNVKRRS